ncbi:MAG TPA: SDR family oxidoreductase [Vicinamibacterales bacterium]|nr:SDR family oxidoreductase [Vicinamibacterales bacterium]
MNTVLITGCSSGIGRMATGLFAGRGWNVVATARQPEVLSDLAAPNVALLQLDVTDETSVAAAVSAAVARFGRIDVLVNNAGYGHFGPLEAISGADLARVFGVNVLGLAAVTRHVLPVMRRQQSGTVVNVSSIGGRVTGPLASAYYASKFAVEGLSDSLAYELKAHGIRVKLVEPAHFKTRFIDRSLQWATHEAYEPQTSNMRAWVEHSDRRAPSAEPVAEAIYRAATDRSARLRYPVKGRVLLAMHAMLPSVLWRGMIAAGLTRRPKAA